MVMKIRKHKTIEIYFVLYLAALILLIPEKKEIEQQNSDFIARTYLPDMSLNIEQNTLNCFINSDSTGLKIASLDSMNTIFWSDNIENISFDFYIEDASIINQQVSDNPYKLISFRTIENIKENKAVFYWEPKLPIFQNKSYIVHVTANATTKKENKDESITYQTVKLKGKFGINIVYNKNIKTTPFDIATNNLPMDTGHSPVNPYIPYSNTSNLQNFNIILEKSDFKLIASQNWQNTVIGSNINFLQDLAIKPELKVICEPENNGGEAFISETSPERILLKGKTPSFGKMTVQIRVVRKYDKEEIKTSFRVTPQGIEHPEFAEEMYPEKTYTINPKLPLTSTVVKSYIRDGSKILAASQQGEKFNFTPDFSLINKTLVLERYIDDKLFGQKYNIKILNFPNPEISDLKKGKNGEVILTTKCYGKYSRQFNEIVSLEIEGNAKYRELRGNLRSYEEPLPTKIQEFIITPINSAKPFEFKVYAVDKKGKKTLNSSYKE